MSTATPLRAPAQRTAGRTTYAILTERAALRIARAQALASRPASQTPAAVTTHSSACTAAHRDLACALAHLGRTLGMPGSMPLLAASDARSVKGRAARRRSGPNRAGEVGAATLAARELGPSRTLLADLTTYGQAREWETPAPVEGPAGDLAGAARLIRAAADLWATHHTSQGTPRGPEASRMRHPATLGAATRQWHDLVWLAAAAGEAVGHATSGATPTAARGASDKALAADDTCDSPRPGGASNARTFPTVPVPSRAAAPFATTEHSLDLTVCRPGVRRGQGPLTELSDRVDRLRHLAWASATPPGSAGTPGTPAIVLANLAAIGIALHEAAAEAHRRVGASVTGHTRGAHWRAAEQAQAARAHWRDAAELIRCLRTPHPPTHPVQVERLDIHTLLRRIPARATGPQAADTAWALTRICATFGQVAGHNARGLIQLHEQGDLLMLGRGIPRDALGRRSDLLAARLNDRVVNAPTLVVDRLAAIYRALEAAADEQTGTQSPAADPAGGAPNVAPPAA